MRRTFDLRRSLSASMLIVLIATVPLGAANADSPGCSSWLDSVSVGVSARWEKIKATAIDKILRGMAYTKGLPKYRRYIEESRQSGSYRLNYRNFGHMGLAEIGISVRFNQASLKALDTGRGVTVVSGHPLGIGDGLALQYLVSKARPDVPTVLFMARWIEELLPHAVFGDEFAWGTAIPVDINVPKKTKEIDPEYEAKISEINKFNSSWTRIAIKLLRAKGGTIFFPRAHVSDLVEGEEYPDGVYDAPNSWNDGFLDLARLGRADIVFAHVASVNSRAFYRKRKRFGGGDLERVVWFFGEAIAKRGKVIDVYLSKPMSLDEAYDLLVETYKYPRDVLTGNSRLTAELMRQYSRDLSRVNPQKLDTTVLPVAEPLPSTDSEAPSLSEAVVP